MLKVENASRTFNNGLAGFKDLSFAIQEGETVGILGTSGCGKSTLLRVLSGLDAGFEGDIVLASLGERPIGMIFQEPRLMPWLTVKENILFGVKDKKSVDVQEYLNLVGLSEFGNHFPKDLSGGMAQRTAIARALIGEPSVLLLDEPFSALDAFTKMQLQDLLLEIQEIRSTTMIIVTHDIDEALYLCDRILILGGQPGRLEGKLSIEEAKPRDRGDSNLAAKKAKILDVLHIE
ncbi:ABC transporter ATP-binding protein [Oceanobacillus indicireducens]|uniref:Aliphatic sulfonates import ATP-binding protein SsuB 2 n=1 Tax=Oceanobacillus indicireducens TaxID=1004261 RepID=A0A918D2U6_9BACI|nr:ABC transporter ATP-binding protein [Oceanobacillus indicireducens]GGN61968.1 aliphatic sulfonates import ATP-binding protein SsuB 2 [Oceanobacillus indicireducens]